MSSWKRWRTSRLFETEASALLISRTTAPSTVAAVVLADLAVMLLIYAWLFHQRWLVELQDWSDGFVGGTLVATLSSLAVTLVLACGVGRLRLRDLGLTMRGWLAGTAIVLAMWAVIQLVLLLVALASGDGIAPGATCNLAGAAELFQQVFGNAPAEEVLFRGFLFVQLVQLARRGMSGPRAWVLGLVISQLIFALSHLPNRWEHDLHGLTMLASLGGVFWHGTWLALLYVRTGNLAIAMGVHALANNSVELVASPLAAHHVRSALELALLIAWPYPQTTTYLMAFASKYTA